MACEPNVCGQIMTEFVLNLAALRTPTTGTIGVFAIEGPLAASNPPTGQVFLADILEMADEALKQAVKDEADQRDPARPNRVFSIVADPKLAPNCADGCECAGVRFVALSPETKRVTATIRFQANTYSVTTIATRTVFEGVGRCRATSYDRALSFAVIPELNLALAVARDRPVTPGELTRLGQIFS